MNSKTMETALEFVFYFLIGVPMFAAVTAWFVLSMLEDITGIKIKDVIRKKFDK